MEVSYKDMKKIDIKKALNPAYRKHKPLRNEVLAFIGHLKECIESIKISDENKESEEHLKEPIKKFFKSTFFQDNYINTKERIDLAIYLDKTVKSDIGVIIEAKRPSNKSEFISQDNLNKKALQELLLYYLRERVDNKNNNIKHLIATNGFEWFLFKAEDFYNLFYKNKALIKEYEAFRDGLKDTSKNELFYNEIAKKYISVVEEEIPFVHIDFYNLNIDKMDDNKLSVYYKIFSDVHLLGHSFGNDSNQLNTNFYNELLHIIGLEEVNEGSKKVIRRKDEGSRDYSSLLENTIFTLVERDYLRNVTPIENSTEKAFNVGLELCLTWINRILFLKLLESQLATYHKGAKEYRFLNSGFLGGFDDLNDLFFSGLAKPVNERHPKFKEKYKYIPYLNSSLFERNEVETETFDVASLNDEEMTVHASTVLKDSNGKRFKGKLRTLDYLFRFLDAYDFATDDSEGLSEGQESKTLINASVLGLIFEKINGYKDGSFYTPAFITMYMCRENIRNIVIGKFKEQVDESIETFEDVINYCHRFFKSDDIKRFNSIINNLHICDPAVGSGHFLVSALNELIAIKSELGILADEKGVSLKVEVQIVNDELYISDAHGNLFGYQPSDPESTRIQKTLFEEKQTLIENCLFGVDINPNSVKICRLRLWIELLKNAYYTTEKQLHTLPNIDINIKAGNSLISRFDITDNLKDAFKGKEAKYNFKEYKRAVSDYKNSKSKEQKYAVLEIINHVKQNFRSSLDKKIKDKFSKIIGDYENEEQRLKNLILFDEKIKKAEKDNLNKLKLKASKAQQEKEEIINNVIYNNAFEWRFEFPEVLDDDGNYIGFDAIIGNPPYGVSIKGKEREHLVKTLGKVPDNEIYYFFIELAHKLLKVGGIQSYIIPNTYLFNTFASAYRVELFNKWELTEILDCTKFSIFQTATVRNTINTWKKGRHNFVGYRKTKDQESFNELIDQERTFLPIEDLLEMNQNWGLAFMLDANIIEIISEIKKETIPLSKIFPDISQGLIAYDKYRGQSEEIIKNRAYHYKTFDKPDLKKWLWGSDVTKFKVEWNGQEYIDYCAGIANPRNPDFFKGERLLIREITNPSIFAGITSEELYNDPSILIIKSNENYSVKWLCALINSKLATFFHFNYSPKATKGAFPKILVQDIKEFPIIVPENLRPFEILVDYLIFLNAKTSKNDLSSKIKISYFEQIIDGMVYETYFPNLLSTNKRDVLQYLDDLVPISNMTSEENISTIIDEMFNKYDHKDHQIKNNLFFMRNLEEIAIIEGLK